MGLKQREPKVYASVISDGTIRVKTSESDPKAVRRDFELRDGTKGTKFELVYNELTGFVTAVEFYKGDFGTQLNITITDKDDESDKTILALNVGSNYAEDMMKKLPAIDLTKEVTLKPYNFTDDKKKQRRGISVQQEDGAGKAIKVHSFFHNLANNPINGFPELEKNADGTAKEYDTEDWKIYFIQTRKFLQKYIEDNWFSMLGQAAVKSATPAAPVEPAEEEINQVADDVPADDINVNKVMF